MSGVFRWSMRHGAKLLLALALIQVLLGLFPLLGSLLSTLREMAGDHDYHPQAAAFGQGMEIQLLWSTVAGAAFPFFGALLIDRLDRWLDGKGGEKPE